MTIRQATRSDMALLHAVETAVFPDTVYPAFFFRQAFDLWPELLHVAEDESGTVSGYAMGAASSVPGVAWLLSMAVHPAMQGKGAGRALLASMFDAMRAKNFTAVQLTVDPANPVLRLYKTSGFREIQQEDDYFQPGDRRIVMQRIIDV
ncbi:MAG: GNAT family N-acetyltransferase [Proteobacteria bacterium]|nr:GNAT family N-acetyltransferase [Pseudomonadota bacterium]